MLKRGIALGFGLALFCGFAAGASAVGKPADLPANNQIECPDCGDDPLPGKFSLELDFTPKGITVKMGVADAQPELPPAIDALLPAFVEQWLQHAGDAFSYPDRSGNIEYWLGQLPYIRSLQAASVGVDDKTGATPKVVGAEPKPAPDIEKQLRQIFESADQYRRTGLYESARYLYQRVHLLAPTSRLGRLAIEHLQEIESRLRSFGETEEQGNPDRRDEPEARQRDIRNGAMPLGLVRVRY
jgi:hypothetical protein